MKLIFFNLIDFKPSSWRRLVRFGSVWFGSVCLARSASLDVISTRSVRRQESQLFENFDFLVASAQRCFRAIFKNFPLHESTLLSFDHKK